MHTTQKIFFCTTSSYYFNFASVLSHYDTHSSLLFNSTFMFFLYSLQIINILVQISCRLDESIILEHNPSFVRILLGNSKKSYASTFLFSFPRVFFSGENYIDVLIFCALLHFRTHSFIIMI